MGATARTAVAPKPTKSTRRHRQDPGAPYESEYFMMIVGVYATPEDICISARRSSGRQDDPHAKRSQILSPSPLSPAQLKTGASTVFYR